jgi:hypothetical protein
LLWRRAGAGIRVAAEKAVRTMTRLPITPSVPLPERRELSRAREFALEILRRAETERDRIAKEEAKRGIQYDD